MKFKSILAALFVLASSCGQVLAQATILPPGETCFQATAGLNGMLGLLGSITGGSSYTNGTYGGVPLTGGSGVNATANISVSGGIVTQVTVLNPGIQYVAGDVLSANPATIGGTGSGFSVSVSSTSINSSLAGGAVAFYFPTTQSYKQTWVNSAETVPNQNPVPLDQNGCAVIYGAGVYSMTVFDSLGNTVYTQLTASTSPIGIFWAGLAAGTPNAITITDSSFAFQDGATIQFLAKAENTGPVTIAISGGSQIAIVKDTSSGPAALSGGEIGPENTPLITYDAANAEFHLVNPAASTGGGGGTTAGLNPPQGYLNLVGQASGDVIQTGDVVGVATVFYSPFTGNQIPIWNGTSFVSVTFSEMTAILTVSGSPANTIQDQCVFSNNGVPTLVTGPSWSNVAAGSGARGTGAGTAQLTRLNGIWVNANSIVGYNGLSSYSISANQCTYVGSIQIDATAGQVSAYRSIGQNRKFGIWNAYNRQRIVLQISDPTSSWTDGGTAWHNTNSSTSNSMTTFTGLPEEEIAASYQQTVNTSGFNMFVTSASISIGINATSPTTSSIATKLFSSNGTTVLNTADFIKSTLFVAPALGANTLNALSNIGLLGTPTGPSTYYGQSYMLMDAEYRG